MKPVTHETVRPALSGIRWQAMWPDLLQGRASTTSVVVVLVLVTLIAAQDFYLADYDTAHALKRWWVDASFHVINIDALVNLLQGHPLPGNSDTGVAWGFYHFISYIPAALGCVVFGISPIKSYALIYAPLSVFLFAFGIWWLAAAFWTKEQALWATALFMLLPDAMPYLASSHEFLRL